MNTLDRYILREFLKIFILIVISLISLYLIVDFFERIRMFLSNHASFFQMLSYFAFTVPMILSQMLPVTVLLSSLLTYGMLSKNSEITAMKANGISLYRITLPVVLFSVIISGLTFALNEFITPATNERAKYIKYIEVQKRKSLGAFKQNEIWYRGKLGIYNFSMFEPETGTLKGVRINYLNKDMALTKRIDAKEAHWDNGRWIFKGLMTTTFPGNDFPRIERASSAIIEIPEKPSDFMVVQKDTDEMGFRELRKYIRKIRSEGYDATRYVTDMQGKIAFPFICIILSVLGISFSIRSERSGGIAQSIGVGILLGFSYWILYAFAISLGRAGTLPPLVAAWAANLVFGSMALFLLAKVRS